MRVLGIILVMLLGACHERNQSLAAFGGLLVGEDRGEWGGGITFYEPDGRQYKVIAKNSRGIFEMPYGVIAFTGVAHLSINEGAIHLLSRTPNGRVSTRLLMQLSHVPSEIKKVDNRLTFKTGNLCHQLISAKALHPYECPVATP